MPDKSSHESADIWDTVSIWVNKINTTMALWIMEYGISIIQALLIARSTSICFYGLLADCWTRLRAVRCDSNDNLFVTFVIWQMEGRRLREYTKNRSDSYHDWTTHMGQTRAATQTTTTVYTKNQELRVDDFSRVKRRPTTTQQETNQPTTEAKCEMCAQHRCHARAK